ncbi:MAG: alpha/beta hydrolase [Bacteroidota bacterium]
MSLLLILLLCVVTFIVTISALVFVIGPIMVLNPRRRGEEFYRVRDLPTSPLHLQLPYEQFNFLASDAISLLNAWFIPAKNPKATIIYLHGVGDNKMSGLLLANVFYRHNFNVLLYDSRAHGESGGKYCTYGYHEKHDVQIAIYEALKKFPQCKIGVFGTSMGAAVALQAASIEPRITAVVAEASFATLRQITVDYQKRLLRLPWHFLRNIAMKRSEIIARFKHREVSPIEAVKNIRVPILFIHGKDDTFIKYQYSEEMYAVANEPKELWLIDKAHHNDVHEIGRSEYEGRIVQFFERYLL